MADSTVAPTFAAGYRLNSMIDRYADGQYLADHPSWHVEDSPWKAAHIAKIIARNNLKPNTIAEIGCGAGGVLGALHGLLPECDLIGYDISRHAIDLARRNVGVKFFADDPLQEEGCFYDLLLVIDVFEHVPDYIGFLERCRTIATYKVYHIPLDIHVSSVIRNSLVDGRKALGHLHYFSEATALATLKDTGHQILDSFLTAGAVDLFTKHPSLKTAAANVPRWLTAKLSPSLAARLFGGYSLLVLAR